MHTGAISEVDYLLAVRTLTTAGVVKSTAAVSPPPSTKDILIRMMTNLDLSTNSGVKLTSPQTD
jgi:hypothetical protein